MNVIYWTSFAENPLGLQLQFQLDLSYYVNTIERKAENIFIQADTDEASYWLLYGPDFEEIFAYEISDEVIRFQDSKVLIIGSLEVNVYGPKLLFTYSLDLSATVVDYSDCDDFDLILDEYALQDQYIIDATLDPKGIFIYIIT